MPIPGVNLTLANYSHYGFVPPPGTFISSSLGLGISVPFLLVFRQSLFQRKRRSGDRDHPSARAGLGTSAILPWGPSATNTTPRGRRWSFHNPAAFSDAGAFTISTVVVDGLPLIADFIVRGTTSDIWVFGGAGACIEATRNRRAALGMVCLLLALGVQAGVAGCSSTDNPDQSSQTNDDAAVEAAAAETGADSLGDSSPSDDGSSQTRRGTSWTRARPSSSGARRSHVRRS